ncbi:hypothetical protein TRICI_004875 [Trichomonascus ciferrii]|uniref:Uncharacterized protein n=1 Tax=Trichomonascus ciferrii TaxID=44093 RepID=A0A642UY90_9ASCO|nr:hypothetical protein TRICI_004875 [Trichomonascus ciferrii]
MGPKKGSGTSKKQQKGHNDKGAGNISGLDGAAPKPAPPSSLSSKILDMKFMKKANVQQEAEKQAEKTKKIHDSSRWKLTFQSEDKPIAKKHRTINFSELNDDDDNDDQIKGRRSWGNFNNNISEKEEPSGNRTSDDEDTPETNETVSEDKEATLKRKKSSSNDKKKKKKQKK